MDRKSEFRHEVYQRLVDAGVTSDPPGRIPAFAGEGRAAERLRRWSVSREAATVFFAPDGCLIQARVNALLDGKRLIVATPGLRHGFVLLERSMMPFNRIKEAVSSRGLLKFGKRVGMSARAGPVDLMITGAFAVDFHGERLGKGAGFFDLEYALLLESGWISGDVPIAAIVHDLQIVERLPSTDRDVTVDAIAAPAGLTLVSGRRSRPQRFDLAEFDPRIIHLPPVKELLAR